MDGKRVVETVANEVIKWLVVRKGYMQGFDLTMWFTGVNGRSRWKCDKMSKLGLSGSERV